MPNNPPSPPQHKFETEIAVLVYGDYSHLAERCLTPLVSLREAGVPVRVYANEPSDKTVDVVHRLGFFPEIFNPQIYKYPVLKKAIDACNSRFFMWVDDDSVITAKDPVDWLKSEVEWYVKRKFADLIGSLYTIFLTEAQRAWVTTRPWYGKLTVNRKVTFPQGGWWVARTEFLRDLGWPDPDLVHNGGDVMLGVACSQNGSKMWHFKDGVVPNASYPEMKESKSPRRGYSELPVGTKRKE